MLEEIDERIDYIIDQVESGRFPTGLALYDTLYIKLRSERPQYKPKECPLIRMTTRNMLNELEKLLCQKV